MEMGDNEKRGFSKEYRNMQKKRQSYKSVYVTSVMFFHDLICWRKKRKLVTIKITDINNVQSQ